MTTPSPKPCLWAVHLAGIAIVGLSSLPSDADGPSADIRAARSQSAPDWVFDGFLSVQTAEGDGLRRGYSTVQTPKNIAERLDPQVADRLADQGIHLVILNGVMGSGLSNEMDQVRVNKPLAAALKAKGIRRVLYVQTIGTMFYESFCAETPAAANWLQRRPNGEAPIYYTQWFRKIPCINNDEYIDYLKNVIGVVMKELDLDGIFCDNYGYYSYSCRCLRCQSRFREYLNHKYPDMVSRRARFGNMTSFDFVVPPPFYQIGDASGHTSFPDRHQILDPISQEWIRFRCERLGEVTQELSRTVKEANPEGILFLNYLYGGMPGLNNAVFHGSWPAFVYPHTDLISAEVSGPPHFTQSGVAQGRALLMKVAKHFDIPLSTCTFHAPLSSWKRLYLAEGFAFNTAPMDLGGDIFRDDPPPWMRDYLSFYETHRELLARADTVADCAVLHNFESLSFACTHPQESLVLCEQSLLQSGVTFDIIFDKDLEHLDFCTCLVLPDVVAMSRSTVAKITDWVKAGGSLVVTDFTALLNERMQPWKGQWLVPERTMLFAEALGIKWPEKGLGLFQVGKGRVSVITEIIRPWDPGVHRGKADQEEAASPLSYGYHSYGPAMPMVLTTPALAGNHEEIAKAVDYAVGEARVVRIDAPERVVVEVTRNAQAMLVHLVNWNEAEPVTNIKVSLRAPTGRDIKSVRLISPDREVQTRSFPFETKEGRIEFVVPKLICYDVMVLQ